MKRFNAIQRSLPKLTNPTIPIPKRAFKFMTLAKKAHFNLFQPPSSLHEMTMRSSKRKVGEVPTSVLGSGICVDWTDYRSGPKQSELIQRLGAQLPFCSPPLETPPTPENSVNIIHVDSAKMLNLEENAMEMDAAENEIKTELWGKGADMDSSDDDDSLDLNYDETIRVLENEPADERRVRFGFEQVRTCPRIDHFFYVDYDVNSHLASLNNEKFSANELVNFPERVERNITEHGYKTIRRTILDYQSIQDKGDELVNAMRCMREHLYLMANRIPKKLGAKPFVTRLDRPHCSKEDIAEILMQLNETPDEVVDMTRGGMGLDGNNIARVAASKSTSTVGHPRIDTLRNSSAQFKQSSATNNLASHSILKKAKSKPDLVALGTLNGINRNCKVAESHESVAVIARVTPRRSTRKK